MTDTSETAARTEPGGRRPDDRGDPETGPSSATAVAERPSFLDWLSTLFRQKNGASLREELSEALAESASDAAAFSPAERAMLNNILRLREVRVEDVMVPRAGIEAVPGSTTLGSLLVLFEESGHSRMPVYADSLDDPKGMVHIRDVLSHIARAARPDPHVSGRAALDLGSVDLTKTIDELGLVRTVLFVPPTMLASDLMARMQAAHIQIALVIDEYGGTDGLVSMEDIVETVVGDIEDEHDDEQDLVHRVADGSYEVDAKAAIEDVAATIGSDFAPGENAEDVDTIGGMILNALGRVPQRGEVFDVMPGFEFTVLDADPRRVIRVRIARRLDEGGYTDLPISV